jgi:hypothetical protein
VALLLQKRIDASVRRDTAMEESKNVIWSLLPLILIVLFSWLFGFLGKKMKKPQEDTDVSLNRAPEDQPLDIFSAIREAAGQISASEGPTGPNGRMPTPAGSQAWRPERGFTGPRITPTPITPKWWGA